MARTIMSEHEGACGVTLKGGAKSDVEKVKMGLLLLVLAPSYKP